MLQEDTVDSTGEEEDEQDQPSKSKVNESD